MYADSKSESTTTSLAQEDVPIIPVGIVAMLKILFRWSPIIVPLAVGGMYYVVQSTSSIQPEYMAEASVLLTGPNEYSYTDVATDEVFTEEVNPLTTLDSSFPTIASVTALAISDDDTRGRLSEEGLSTNIVVWAPTRTPLVNIEASAEDSEVARATADRLIELIQDDLRQRQVDLGAPAATFVVGMPVTATVVGGADYGGRNRTRIAFAVAVLAGSAAIGFLFEGFRQLIIRRRAAKRARAEAKASSDLVSSSGQGSGRPLADRVADMLYLVTGDQELARWLAVDSIVSSTSSGIAKPTTETAFAENEPAVFGLAFHRARRYLTGTGETSQTFGPAPAGFDHGLWRRLASLSIDTRGVLALSAVAGLPRSVVANIVGLSEERTVEILETVGGASSIVEMADVESANGDAASGDSENVQNQAATTQQVELVPTTPPKMPGR